MAVLDKPSQITIDRAFSPSATGIISRPATRKLVGGFFIGACITHTPGANPMKPKTITKPEPVKSEPKVDHFAAIAELVAGLENTSPSGAMTIGQKIMGHLNAIKEAK